MNKVLLALTVLAFAALPSFAQTTVTCESSDGRYRECRLEGVGVATLTRQISESGCVEGQTWGYRDGRIWVDRGCRGDFSLTARAASAPLDARLVCESADNRLSRCTTDTAAGVQLVRRISDSPCQFGRDWGYDANGVWVTNGCRGEFAVSSSAARLAAVPVAATNVLTCESVNNGRAHCRADTRNGVEIRRQISDTNCVRNSTWGVDANGVWVTGGCRAEFVVGGDRWSTPSTVTAALPATLPATLTVLCESRDNRRSDCRADTSLGAILARQISDSACVLNSTWGFDRNGLWVTGGCRGEFLVGDARLVRSGMLSSASTAVAPSGVAPTLVCESSDGQHKHCRADTRYGVTLLRRLSDARCERDRSWGVDDLGVWVTNGCRAEFVLERR